MLRVISMKSAEIIITEVFLCTNNLTENHFSPFLCIVFAEMVSISSMNQKQLSLPRDSLPFSYDCTSSWSKTANSSSQRTPLYSSPIPTQKSSRFRKMAFRKFAIVNQSIILSISNFWRIQSICWES